MGTLREDALRWLSVRNLSRFNHRSAVEGSRRYCWEAVNVQRILRNLSKSCIGDQPEKIHCHPSLTAFELPRTTISSRSAASSRAPSLRTGLEKVKRQGKSSRRREAQTRGGILLIRRVSVLGDVKRDLEEVRNSRDKVRERIIMLVV